MSDTANASNKLLTCKLTEKTENKIIVNAAKLSRVNFCLREGSQVVCLPQL